MTIKPVHSLSDIIALPTSQTGTWARLLSQLVQQKVDLTGGFVIPIETLKQIAATNGLAEKLTEENNSQNQPDIKKVISIFSRIHIPDDIAHAWLKAFYEHIGDQPAYIKASWVESVSQNIFLATVKGDANVMEAMLEVWAKAVAFKLTNSRTSMNLLESVAPAALVIQAQPKPQAYGWVKSNLGLPHLKSAVLIRATQSDSSLNHGYDEYTVDVRTWHVISSRVHHPIPVLDANQIKAIAQAGYQTKLLHIDHGQLYWSINHLHLTMLEYETDYVGENPQITSTQKPLMSGKSLIPGIINGHCHLVSGRLPTMIGHNHIIVTKNLVALPTHTLKQIRGVITEEVIQPIILKQLQTFHIPTMAQVPKATKRLREGQSIILDTVQNGIFGVVPGNTATSPQLHTTLVIETAQELLPHLAELKPNDVLFRPEYSLVQYGVHPLHFIRSSQREILFKSLSDKLLSFRAVPHFIYRQSNLSSSDLAGLQYGGQFEHPERNPDYGYRGALRALSQSEIFDFELDVLAHVHRHNQQQVTLLVSGVRSPGEYRLISQHIQHHLPESSWLNTWLEIATPENAIEYSRYNHMSHQAIVINLPQLHALAHGIDPHNQDVYRLYSWNNSLMRHLVNHVIREAGNIPCYCICPTDQSSVLEMCLEQKVAGVIVKPPYATQAKEYMMTAEQKQSNV